MNSKQKAKWQPKNPYAEEAVRLPKKRSSKKPAPKKKWARWVTEHSNALDLEQSVFKKKDPGKIARSLKRSAEHSKAQII